MNGNNDRPTPEWVDALETNQTENAPLLTLAAELREAKPAPTASNVGFRESLRARLTRQHARQRSPLSWLRRPMAQWAAVGAAAVAVVLLVLVVGQAPTVGAVQTGQAVTAEPVATAPALSEEQEQILQNLENENVWIENVSPEPGTHITGTTNVQVEVGYDFEEAVEGRQLFLQLFQSHMDSSVLPGSFSQSQTLTARSGTMRFDYELNPTSATVGDWHLAVSVGTDGVRYILLPYANEPLISWCINCLPNGESVAIDRSTLAGSAERRQLVVSGRAASPAASCVRTRLLINGTPASWWPTERCVFVINNGVWRLNVPLYGDDVPQPLPADATYVVEAWLEGEREAAASRDVSATLAEVAGKAQIVIERGESPEGLMRLILEGSSTLPDGTCLNTQLLLNNEAAERWPATRCVPVQDGRWRTTVFTSNILNPLSFEPRTEYEVVAQVWPEGNFEAAVQKRLYATIPLPNMGIEASIGPVDAPIELEILSVEPKSSSIDQAKMVRIDLNYRQFTSDHGGQLAIGLQPVAPLRAGKAWHLLDGADLQRPIALDQQSDDLSLTFAVVPEQLSAGEWELVADYLDGNGVRHRHRFGLHRWCIRCEEKATFTIEEYRQELMQEQESWLFMVGKSDQPDGTCIYTELAIGNNIVEQWPNRECASVEDGKWEIGMSLFDLPPRPNISDEYTIRAWPDGDKSAAIQQTFVP